eukprot:gene15425-20444_t
MNIDTVDDLIALLRGILEAQPPASPIVQLLCIHATLRVEDRRRGVHHQAQTALGQPTLLLRTLASRRREERPYIIQAFMRLLFLHSLQLSAGGGDCSSVAATVLAM